jgi:hypothetical protein
VTGQLPIKEADSHIAEQHQREGSTERRSACEQCGRKFNRKQDEQHADHGPEVDDLSRSVQFCVGIPQELLAHRSEKSAAVAAQTVPAGRMKAKKEHRVPLCDRAVAILSALPRDGARVFPLSDRAMIDLLSGMRPG